MMESEGASTSDSIIISREINDINSATTTKSIILTKEFAKDNNDTTTKSLQGWSKAEKLQLYKALKSYGSADIGNILCEVPTKSPIEIQHAIQHYKNRLKKTTPVESVTVETRERAIRKQNKYSVPLTNWATVLAENLDFNDLQNEIAEAIRIYADFGNIPKSHLTDNVNFRDLYLLLADAMDGKPLTSYNNTQKQIIRECILHASLFSSEFVKTAAFEYIYQNIDIDNCNVSMFTKPSSDEELSCLRHVISQKKFNPYNISEHDLRKSLDIKNKSRR